MKNYIFGILLCSISAAANSASLETTSTIKTLFMGPEYGKRVFIQVEDRPTQARPSGCTDNSYFDFVIDLTSDHGKEYYSAVLAAYMAKKTVRIRSYDRCTTYGSVPDLKDILLK